jgi:hypothetical protein
MPGNLDVWDLWQSAATQWRASGFGLVGLDYLSVQLVASLLGVTLNDAALQRIQLLESWTLTKMAEQSEKAAKGSPSATRGNSHG